MILKYLAVSSKKIYLQRGIFITFIKKKMIAITGRQEEIEILENCLTSSRSEFAAIYGRRRVGKTFLVREVFGNKFSFQFTGLANATTKQQLESFHEALQK